MPILLWREKLTWLEGRCVSFGQSIPLLPIVDQLRENFGIAVAEALGCGLPALISDKVNIWREVEADGAGFVASDTVAGTVASLRHWLELEPSLAAAMRAQARQTFHRRFTVEAMSKDLLRVLQAGAREGRGTVEKRPLTV